MLTKLQPAEKMPMTLDPFRFLLVSLAGWTNQQRQDAIEYLREENRVLRAQPGNRLRRPGWSDESCWRTWQQSVRRRLCWAGIESLSPASTTAAPGAAPADRPRGKRSNPWSFAWQRKTGIGVTLRIQGALSNLGHQLARGTIANILKRNGIEPAPERVRKTTWKEFLTQHWDLIVAADFFTVEVWTRKGLQRFLVLFFIELSTRRVQIAGISARSDGLWMNQIARNLTDAEDGLLKGKRYLIHDSRPGSALYG
jgi:hypothetical protein